MSPAGKPGVVRPIKGKTDTKNMFPKTATEPTEKTKTPDSQYQFETS